MLLSIKNPFVEAGEEGFEEEVRKLNLYRGHYGGSPNVNCYFFPL